MKTVKYYLHKFDGIWSVPLAFLAFWLVGLLLTNYFGFATGTYDPGFIQPLFLATVVVIGATNAGVLGLFFTIRGFHDYLYGKKEGRTFVNPSKVDWKLITPANKFLITLLTLAYFITLIIIVYLHLV